MDVTMALTLLFSALLLVSAAAFAAATFILLRHCLTHRTAPSDPESPPPQKEASTAPTKTNQEAPPLPHKHDGEARRLAWREVQALTGGFHEAAVVGRGGSSTVYAARLGNGSAAAVKVHRCGGGERRLRAFRQELELLRRLRHPHIVRLLAYSDDHEEEGALVLEYLAGGSLADRLHGASTPPLPWPHRMRILHDVSGALEHLHDASGGPIVHGDVTASNVLLDGRSGGARLCDFGSTRAGFSAAVAATSAIAVGSPGYADPFFLRTGLLSKKSDVYSFGVLVLEAITGLPAVGSDGEKNLTARILPRLRTEGVEGLVDPRLGEDYNVAEASDVARIAVECVGPQPGLRPAMPQVRTAIGEKAARSITGAVDWRSDGSKFS